MLSLFRSGERRSFLLDMVIKGARCAEVGVWKGDFSEAILSRVSPDELHLVDPWKFRDIFPKRWYGGSIAASQSDMDQIAKSVERRFAGNSAVHIHRLPSLDAVAQFPDRYFDWVYIDGDHSYEAVARDLEAWGRKVKTGGLISGDDYLWRDESGRQSVKRAVDEFLAKHAITALLLKRQQFVARVA
jgi:hypothetical protein